MMAVVSFFVEKHRGIRHIVCRKTVYTRVKLHNYTLYARIHTYFFVRSVKNAEKMSAVLLKMTQVFLCRKWRRCQTTVGMERRKMTFFYRGNVFLEEKNTNAPIDFLVKNE